MAKAQPPHSGGLVLPEPQRKRPSGDVCRWQTPIADRAEGENLAASQRDTGAAWSRIEAARREQAGRDNHKARSAGARTPGAPFCRLRQVFQQNNLKRLVGQQQTPAVRISVLPEKELSPLIGQGGG